jgi:hypothetical protein
VNLNQLVFVLDCLPWAAGLSPWFPLFGVDRVFFRSCVDCHEISFHVWWTTIVWTGSSITDQSRDRKNVWSNHFFYLQLRPPTDPSSLPVAFLLSSSSTLQPCPWLWQHHRAAQPSHHRSSAAYPQKLLSRKLVVPWPRWACRSTHLLYHPMQAVGTWNEQVNSTQCMGPYLSFYHPSRFIAPRLLLLRTQSGSPKN